MNNTLLHRRKFLQMGVTGVSLFASGLIQSSAFAAERDGGFHSLANIGPLQAPDANGIRLPPGFRSRIVARSGHAASTASSYIWHAAPDGGACFATEDGGWVYVSNSERGNGRGGVGALRFNANGDVIDSYPILDNTSVNCAGGATPWGTWLSCEEFEQGQVYECDPMGRRPAVVRPLLGTFEHEAAAVDMENNCIYLTEDVPDGGFYRFVADNPLPDLTAGRLQVAEVVASANGDSVRWHDIPDPLAQLAPTRYQIEASSGFAGGEGIATHDGKTWFTTKRDNRVWCYDNNSQAIEIIYDAATSSNPILTGVDNVVITPAGDVLVAEDGGDMQIIAITPDHQLLPLVHIVGHDESEICGPAFAPGHQRMYFSSQRGALGRSETGITYEISAI